MPERYLEMLASGMLGGFTRWVMTMTAIRTRTDSLYFLLKCIVAGVFLATLGFLVDLGWGVFANEYQAVAVALVMGFTWQILMPYLDRWARRKTDKLDGDSNA
jgi:hypothetical protein